MEMTWIGREYVGMIYMDIDGGNTIYLFICCCFRSFIISLSTHTVCTHLFLNSSIYAAEFSYNTRAIYVVCAV